MAPAKTPNRSTKPPRKTQPTATVPVGGEVLTLEEAAAYLRVSPEQVDELATRRDVPARKIGDQWRFHRAALVDWLCQLSHKERVMRHAGTAKDDPYRDEMLRTICQNRGRPMTEDES